jgi:hypothetical protein
MKNELELIGNESFTEIPDLRTPTEIMEEDKQLHAMYEFFEKLIEKGEYKRARSIAWALYFQYGLEVDGLRE